MLTGLSVSGTLFSNVCCILAPEDLLFEAKSSTELSLTFVPTENPGADFYFVNFMHGDSDTRCLLQASERPLTCKYVNLEPLTTYIFEYSAGVYATGSDIWSSKRVKTALTPANSKLITVSTLPCKLPFCLGFYWVFKIHCLHLCLWL